MEFASFIDAKPSFLCWNILCHFSVKMSCIFISASLSYGVECAIDISVSDPFRSASGLERCCDYALL